MKSSPVIVGCDRLNASQRKYNTSLTTIVCSEKCFELLELQLNVQPITVHIY